jgi:hypothetical protein
MRWLPKKARKPPPPLQEWMEELAAANDRAEKELGVDRWHDEGGAFHPLEIWG